MVKRGGPMLGEEKRLEKPKPAAKKRKPVDKVLATAANMKDHAEIAAYLEKNLDDVDKPHKLIEPLADALFYTDCPADQCAKRLVTLAAARRGEPQILDAIALQLDNWHREDEALEVLRNAVAAGSRNKGVLEMLGRMLVARGDVAGVPLLERAIERDPEWTEPRVALALWLAERDPARALALVEGRDDAKAHDVRAMLHEAAGRAREAELAVREALEDSSDDFEGRQTLADWHFDENRYARALVHAKALFELRVKASARRLGELDLDDIDETIVKCYRLGGAFEAIIPWLVEREQSIGMTADIGWHAWYALTSFHPTRELALAIRCAEVVAERDRAKKDMAEVRAWRIRIASEREQAGEHGLLADLAATGLDDDSTAWVELADAYYAQDHFDASHAAVDRALQLDPKSVGALSTLFNLALAAGDGGALHRAAEAILAAEPTWHQGPEHLGRSFARRGDANAAVTHAKRGAAIAPYCHNAWLAVAEAQIVAGDYARAREAATRSLAIEAAQLGDDISIVQAALFGDAAELERTLAERFKHLAAPPFPPFLERLRAAVQSRTTST